MSKWSKTFSQPNATIQTPIDSPCRVDKKFDGSKFFRVIFGLKNLKTEPKYIYF